MHEVYQRAQVAFGQLLAVNNPGITPNSDGLPGLTAVRKIVGALLTWGMAASVAGIACGAILMALGRSTGRGGMADGGKTTVMWAAVGAVILGGANAIVAFFATAGSSI